MLVAVAFVKLVRPLANHVRAHRHALAAMFARPILRSGQQSRARPEAALPLCDDEPVYFRADFHFEKRLPAHVYPADHSIFAGFGDKHGVLRRGPDSPQSFAHLSRRRRIPKLAGEHGDPRRVGAFRPPDLHFSTHRSLCHSLFSAIPRRALRLCVIVSDLSKSRTLCVAAALVRPHSSIREARPPQSSAPPVSLACEFFRPRGSLRGSIEHSASRYFLKPSSPLFLQNFVH